MHLSGWHRAHLPRAAAPTVAEAPKPRLKLTLIAAALSIALVELDFFALNLSLPEMAEDLGVTTTNLQWVVSGYMLALAAFLIPGGRLGDLFGRKRMLTIGLGIFGLGALGGGLAPSAETVIGFRVTQGVGAAIIFPLAIAIITDAFPPERTMRAIGNTYGVGAIAMAFGPLFGGGLTELVDWRAVLLVLVPASGACIAVVAAGVTESRDATVPRSVDLPGLALVVGGIGALTLGVDRANESGVAISLGLVLLGLLALVAFVFRERAARFPLVDLTLFRNAQFVVVTLMATVANVAFVVATFSVTIFLQQAQGYSPLEAGLIFLAASAAAGAAGPLSGRLGERFNIPRTIAIATVVGSVGLLVLSLESGLGFYVPALAVFGIGYGTGWAMASVGTQTVVPPEQAGGASGVTLTIVIGLAGLGLAAAAMMLEVGSSSLGTSIEDLLRWVAIGAAAGAAALVILATVVGRRQTAAEPPAT